MHSLKGVYSLSINVMKAKSYIRVATNEKMRRGLLWLMHSDSNTIDTNQVIKYTHLSIFCVPYLLCAV